MPLQKKLRKSFIKLMMDKYPNKKLLLIEEFFIFLFI